MVTAQNVRLDETEGSSLVYQEAKEKGFVFKLAR